MFYSIVIPVYNRKDELIAICDSLSKQTLKSFEIIVVDDGSIDSAEPVCLDFKDKLTIKYIYKYNSGPGLSRNVGADQAKGDYIIFLDSDCIVPSQYLESLDKFLLEHKNIDAFGGPDACEDSANDKQKAINYAMTSFFTTGGIRGGGKKRLDSFIPRSFNMGVSRKLWSLTNGFSSMRFGEDMEFSYRIIESGFSTALIQDAYVYHMRRTDVKAFFKQVFFSGMARINLYKRFPRTLKLVHILPAFFALYILLLFPLILFFGKIIMLPIFAVVIIWFLDSLRLYRSVNISLMSVESSFIQIFAYGLGFLYCFWQRMICQKDEDSSYNTDFY
ncbi:MAG: glycosyltransferase [Bacteroidetes bacterium]|nr:glycosyltransferase [Bacteroidota bacterium]